MAVFDSIIGYKKKSLDVITSSAYIFSNKIHSCIEIVKNLPGGLDVVTTTIIIAMKVTKMIERLMTVVIIIVGCVCQREYSLLENTDILIEEVKQIYKGVGRMDIGLICRLKFVAVSGSGEIFVEFCRRSLLIVEYSCVNVAATMTDSLSRCI